MAVVCCNIPSPLSSLAFWEGKWHSVLLSDLERNFIIGHDLAAVIFPAINVFRLFRVSLKTYCSHLCKVEEKLHYVLFCSISCCRLNLETLSKVWLTLSLIIYCVTWESSEKIFIPTMLYLICSFPSYVFIKFLIDSPMWCTYHPMLQKVFCDFSVASSRLIFT